MKGSLYEVRNRLFNGKTPRLPESLERVERCEPYISALGNETLATYEYGLNLFRVWIPQEFQAEILRNSRGDNTQRGIAGKVENIGLARNVIKKVTIRTYYSMKEKNTKRFGTYYTITLALSALGKPVSSGNGVPA